MANVINPDTFEVKNEVGNVLAKRITLGWILQDPPSEPDKKYWILDGNAVRNMTTEEKADVDSSAELKTFLGNIISNRVKYKMTFLTDIITGAKTMIGYNNGQVRSLLFTIKDALDLMDHGLLEDAQDSITNTATNSVLTNGIKNQMVALIQTYLDNEEL